MKVLIDYGLKHIKFAREKLRRNIWEGINQADAAKDFACELRWQIF
jgi:hypothetical protein